ncbi:hypothetical protein [Myxococcus sp. AB025B]|uniref:hypothetical protein n=1 Tax=Myxococcus sp. AB025B TaxID=2562794 RepID=UPI0011424C8F|nr:hypothetical protein [Myxococcus sp. AB025B]
MNPFVDYLNSLRTQDAESSPNYVEENRAESLQRIRQIHPWFPTEQTLRVQTQMSVLVEAMRRDDFPVDLVFLTGDAGDGKTAACMDLARAEGIERPLEPIDTINAWTVIKDASEVPEEQLLESISRCRKERRRLLIAINEGRLRQLQRSADLATLWDKLIEPSLRSWIDRSTADQLDSAMREERVAVVNFRHRMHVRTVTPGLLQIWSRSAFWEDSPACSGCKVRASCPILANIQSVREQSVAQAMTDVLTFAHYAGQRLPFRRLQAVLAFTLTGGLRCRDIEGRSPQLTDRFFWLFFQREPRGGLRPEPIARSLAPADSAFEAEPSRDRDIETLLRDNSSLSDFDRRALQVPGVRESIETFRALRRRAIFSRSTAPAGTVSGQTAPTWARALQYLEEAALKNSDEELLRTVMRGVNRLHRHTTDMSEAISGHQLEPAAFRDPQRASLELALGTPFKVELAKGPVLPALVSAWLESCPSDLECRAWPEHQPRSDRLARLRLDARLVMMLLEVNAGFSFIPALGTHRRQLARFHAQMTSMISADKTRIVLRSGDRAWRLSSAGNKLRFEGHE